MQTFNFAGYSFIGRRKNNEDSYGVFNPNNDICFLAVADGMGGYEGGEIASKLVIDSSIKIIKDFFQNKNVNNQQLKPLIESVFTEAQSIIASKLEETPELQGMGTTLCCLLVYKEAYVWGNLGDSRIYHLSSNSLKQITQDHTFVQAYINEHGVPVPGYILEKSNLITRSISGGNDVADIFPSNKEFEILGIGDIFLLCSDGMIDDKSDSTNIKISNYLIGSENIDKAAKYLISDAFQNGSSDNITALIASYGKFKKKKRKLVKWPYPPNDEDKNSIKLKTKKSSSITRTSLQYILVAAIIVIILFVFSDSLKSTIKSFFTEDENKIQIDTITNDGSGNQNIEEIIDWKPFNLNESADLLNNIYNYNEEFFWEPYNGKGLNYYEIIVSNSNFSFTDKVRKASYKFSKMDSIKAGKYLIEVNAVVNNQLIGGNQVDGIQLK
jgi:PPM family protein phosphatase